MKRKGTINHQFVQRIPAEVKDRAVGMVLHVPVGNERVPVPIREKTEAIRLSLRTSVPGEVKSRQAVALVYLEEVWQSLRSPPLELTHRQIVALSREVYEGWGSLADIDPELADGGESAVTGESGVYAAAMANLEGMRDPLGRSADQQAEILADKVLSRHGLVNVATQSKALLCREIHQALRDGFELGDRQTNGDFSPDPKAARFPPLELPSKSSARPQRHVSIMGIVEGWWGEAKAAGRSVSTYESYRAVAGRLSDFLKHDNAAAVTHADLVRFKDHRIAQGISSKTVGDSDIAGLRSIFNWAVVNGQLPSNPAEKVSVIRSKPTRTRGKSFTPAEASALLAQSFHYQPSKREAPKLTSAKRWVPWLCAYSGARLGEIVQLRKEDVRQQGGDWIITITPEAGTVKDKEVREVVLHPHLVEQGFPSFVEGAAPGHLFITPRKSDGDIRGPWRTAKNRLADFARQEVKDRQVAPNHGWRHLFKTVGREAGIADSVLDGICGHAAKTVGGSYGSVSLSAQREAMSRFPWFSLTN